ncbi:class I SAM-dependent methyltransferase [Ktedonobacteria bacterium brp13]|nr:class I SAM-dependent methyltransferase [Ktedonobacteria bacterium brp13]
MSWFKKKILHTKDSPLKKYSNTETLKEQQISDQNMYMLPKDIREVSRLDFQHYLLRQTISGNYLAPIGQPEAILDVACGTGRWMLEMAQQFPRTLITGIDLTPLSESTITFPKNCRFQQCDIFKGIPFPPYSFDFVHQRFLIFALPVNRWSPVIQEIKRVTRPGGWIELTDPDLTFNNQGPETAKLMNWISQASWKRDMDITIGGKLGFLMQSAGLVNVTVKKVPIPLGDWGGRIGSFLIKDFYGAALTLKPLIVAATDATPASYDAVLAAWVREIEVYHTSCDFYIAYGQCPSK